MFVLCNASVSAILGYTGISDTLRTQTAHTVRCAGLVRVANKFLSSICVDCVESGHEFNFIPAFLRRTLRCGFFLRVLEFNIYQVDFLFCCLVNKLSTINDCGILKYETQSDG